jgi:hypothetical protein
MIESVTTHLLVSACVRAATTEGISITVLRKGEMTNGAILLKINHLDGKADLFSQIYLDDERVWSPLGKSMDEQEADALAAEEISFDPDLWLIEVEDKQGRLWFPGKVLRE